MSVFLTILSFLTFLGWGIGWVVFSIGFGIHGLLLLALILFVQKMIHDESRKFLE